MGLLDYGTLRLMIPGFKSLLVPEASGGTVIFTDDFSRADSSNLGANYLYSGRWGIGNGKAVSISPTTSPSVASTTIQGAWYNGTFQIDKPAGTAVGDYLVAFVNFYDFLACTADTPAGWQQLGPPISYDGSSHDIKLYIFGRLVDGTEGVNWTTNFVGDDVPYYNSLCARITGVHSTSPFDPVAFVQSSSGFGTTQASPVISPATPKSLALLCKIGYNNAPTSGLAGWTTSVTYDTVNSIRNRTVASAGDIASENATVAANDTYMMAALAIRGAESGSGGCIYKGAGLPNDHYIKATWLVPGFTSVTQDAIILQIRQTDGDWTGYRMQLWMDDIGRNQLLIWRQDPYEVLYNVITDTYTSNSTMVVEFGAQGNEVYVKIDGIEHVRVTDTSSPDLTGNSVGWDNVDWIGTFSGRVDNIEVGSL